MMKTSFVVRAAELGAITGARSMAGVTAVACRRQSWFAPLATLLWMAEMLADKTPWVGNRTDALPLAARTLLGAAAGWAAAKETGGSPAAGATVGSITAVIAAHVTIRARRRIALSQLAGGLVEDAIVGAAAAYCAGVTQRGSPSPRRQ